MTHPDGTSRTRAGLPDGAQAADFEKAAARLHDAFDDPNFDLDDLDTLAEEIASAAAEAVPTNATPQATAPAPPPPAAHSAPAPYDPAAYEPPPPPAEPPPPPAVGEENATGDGYADQPSVITPPPVDLPELLSLTDPAGGVAPAPTPDPAPVRTTTTPAADAPEWDRYGLWEPPAREPLHFPDDVESITSAGPDLASLPDPDETPLSATDPDDAGFSADFDDEDDEPQPRTRSLRAAWVMLPGWTRIAIPAAAAAIAVIVLISLLSGGASAPPAAKQGPTVPITPATAAPPSDGPLIPLSTKAPGCPAGSSPDPSGAFDPDKRRAWICARRFGIDYAILTIEFADPVVISQINVTPGFDFVEPNGEDHWNEHRLVTDILWKIGGIRLEQKIAPTRGPATLTVPNLATTVVTATVRATIEPPAAPAPTEGGLPGLLPAGPTDKSVNDTFAIGRIEIIGHPASGSR